MTVNKWWNPHSPASAFSLLIGLNEINAQQLIGNHRDLVPIFFPLTSAFMFFCPFVPSTNRPAPSLLSLQFDFTDQQISILFWLKLSWRWVYYDMGSCQCRHPSQDGTQTADLGVWSWGRRSRGEMWMGGGLWWIFKLLGGWASSGIEERCSGLSLNVFLPLLDNSSILGFPIPPPPTSCHGTSGFTQLLILMS